MWLKGIYKNIIGNGVREVARGDSDHKGPWQLFSGLAFDFEMESEAPG